MEAEVEAPEAPDVPLVQVEGVVEPEQPGEGAAHVRLRPDVRRTCLLFPDCASADLCSRLPRAAISQTRGKGLRLRPARAA